MRGARSLSGFPHRGTRIIPADAGSTMEHTLDVGLVGDHPRGCGEHFVTEDQVVASLGSSPRMRGAHRGQRHEIVHVRIIPADAGSTLPIRPLTVARWDHPRGCGEHLKTIGQGIIQVGSSPRMRGALNCVRIAA